MNEWHDRHCLPWRVGESLMRNRAFTQLQSLSLQSADYLQREGVTSEETRQTPPEPNDQRPASPTLGQMDIAGLSPDVMRGEGPISVVVSLPKTHNPNPVTRKPRTNPNWGTFYKTAGLYFAKDVTVRKRQRLRKSVRLKETKGHDN